jgi:hypothetical protein
VGREGIEPPQPKAADLQSAELTTLLNLPAMGALRSILPAHRASGLSAHNAKCAGLHDVSVDDRLTTIHEDRTLPDLIDLHLEPERRPVT